MFKKYFIAFFLNLICIGIVFPQRIGESRTLSKEERKIKQLEERLVTVENRLANLELKIENIIVKPLAPSSSISSSGKLHLSPPPYRVIETAIKENLREKVPIKWSGSLRGGKNANVQLLQILAIGNYNATGKYWPVRARVSGTCEADLLVTTESRSFDKVGDFRIYQDDYGMWHADIDMYAE